MRVSSDQFAAQLAGVDIILAVMRDETPDPSHSWQEIASDRPGYAAYVHPDESVMRLVSKIARTLDNVALVPGGMSRVLYIRKP